MVLTDGWTQVKTNCAVHAQNMLHKASYMYAHAARTIALAHTQSATGLDTLTHSLSIYRFTWCARLLLDIASACARGPQNTCVRSAAGERTRFALSNTRDRMQLGALFNNTEL